MFRTQKTVHLATRRRIFRIDLGPLWGSSDSM